MSLMAVRLVYFAYAVLMVVGGIAGYAEKGSVISVIAGVLCGALALAGGVVATSNPKLGIGLGIAGAVLALGGMLPRFLKSYSVWPAGTVVAASVVTLIVGVIALLMSSSTTAKS